MCRENFHGMCFWENVSVQLRICMDLQYKTEKLQTCTKIVIYVEKKSIYMYICKAYVGLFLCKIKAGRNVAMKRKLSHKLPDDLNLLL